MTSSLAIVQLQPSRQQPQQQQQQHLNPASTSAAAAATTAAVAAAAPGGGVHALDWSRKLAVFSPDDCQLVNDTPGHFKVGSDSSSSSSSHVQAHLSYGCSIYLQAACNLCRALQQCLAACDVARLAKWWTRDRAAPCLKHKSPVLLDVGKNEQNNLMRDPQKKKQKKLVDMEGFVTHNLSNGKFHI
jgi:hypothetical protein